jgi:hypothetical protein
VIVLKQRHLRRLVRDYVRYYHEDRTHLGLGKETPCGRVTVANHSARPEIMWSSEFPPTGSYLRDETEPNQLRLGRISHDQGVRIVCMPARLRSSN